MKLAIEYFKQLPMSPKAVILGDMRELGETSDTLHAEVVEQVKAAGFDKVLLCGEHFSKVGQAFAPYPDTAALITALKEQPLKGYHILIKGSHSMGLEKVAELL